MPALNDADLPIVELRNIGVEYPGVRALDNVDFDLRAGEIHALMGENGAGKSTLLNILSGALALQEGTMSIGGRSLRLTAPRAAERAGVSIVRQELDLIPTLSIAENICLCRRSGRWGLVRHRAMRQRASRALARLNLQLDVRSPLAECPLATRQMVAIARALDIEARVLILDEPTSSLDSAETQRLFALMRMLRDGGMGILFVTHFLDQVDAVADRITVLRNGRRIVTSFVRDMPRKRLVEAMTGREVNEKPDRMDAISRPEQPARLVVDGLERRNAIAPTSFTVAAGEALGIAGLLGSGRSELARLIFGVDQADSGTVSVDGQRLRGGSISEAIAHGVAFIPEDRRQALALDLSVRENIVLALQASRGALCMPTSSEPSLIASLPRCPSARVDWTRPSEAFRAATSRRCCLRGGWR